MSLFSLFTKTFVYVLVVVPKLKQDGGNSITEIPIYFI